MNRVSESVLPVDVCWLLPGHHYEDGEENAHQDHPDVVVPPGDKMIHHHNA